MKISIAILTLVSIVAGVDNVIRAPIMRNPDQGSTLEIARKKYQYLSKRAGSTYHSDLYNDQGSQYLIQVSVGTPPQNFTVTLDTGSSDLWIPSNKCPTVHCPFTRFDASKSSTYKQLNEPFAIQYGIGKVNGTYVTDTVSVGGASISDQQLGLAFYTEDIMLPPRGGYTDDKESTVANGILGLGYPALTQSNSQGEGPYNPFVFNLVSKGVIQDPVFSIFLNSVSEPGWSGEILFGGIDQSRYIGNLTYLPVAALKSTSLKNKTTTSDYYYWMVYGQGLGVKNSNISNPTWRLREVGAYILDTGTTLTYLPSPVALEIIESIAGRKNFILDRQSGVYVVDCKVAKSPAYFELHMSQSEHITSNPVVLSVPASELVIPIDGTSADNATLCMFGIAPLGGTGSIGSNMYLIGDSVLRSAYMVYDMGKNQVGLAANKGIGGSVGFNSTLSKNPKSSSTSSKPNYAMATHTSNSDKMKSNAQKLETSILFTFIFTCSLFFQSSSFINFN